MNAITSDLSPVGLPQSSFYGKAHITVDYDNDFITLFSYGTPVMLYYKPHGTFTVLKDFVSLTTNRHITAFINYITGNSKPLKFDGSKSLKKFLNENVGLKFRAIKEIGDDSYTLCKLSSLF